MSPIDVLVVGAGAMGSRHAAAVRASGDRVRAVVDPRADRAAEVAAGAAVYASVEDALAGEPDLEAAVVTTPSADHLATASRLLGAGLAVLLEKPHRIPGQDPAPLEAAVAAGGRLMIGMSTRHWPGVAATADAIAAGELGEIVGYDDRLAFPLGEGALPPWYFDRAVSGGGILVTNGVHALDRARALLGAELAPRAARLRAALPGHETEDLAELALDAAGVPVRISLAWTGYEPVDTGLVVLGTRGTARVGMDGAWLVRTADGERGGEAIDLDALPFRAQWSAFRAETPGFALADLEPTLRLIETLYREEAAHA